MRWMWTTVTAVGLTVSGVGLLWFLQGSDLVHIDPIACVGDCAAIRGRHTEWQLAGIVAVLAGAAAMTLGVQRLHRGES